MSDQPPANARHESASDYSAPPPVANEPLNRLFALVQDELRRVAHRKLKAERANHTLSTTALVNETYLKLAKQNQVAWSDRGQFFALASQAMRRILIDYARRHRRMREKLRYDSQDATDDGDGHRRAIRLAATQRADELLALDEALERLFMFNARLAHVVECRFFSGLTEEETARTLGVTPRTVGRDWADARKWLYRELSDSRAE